MNRDALVQYLAQLLSLQNFQDYCPNGLQVEGKEKIHTIVTGVSACQQLIDQALFHQADALLVHHGYFWKGESPCITGIKKTRLSTLLAHQLNLFAYHLPLDAHPTLGNNAQLAKLMNWEISAQVGDPSLLFVGQCERQSQATFTQHLTEKLKRTPLVVGKNAKKHIEKIAWCTGAAQDWIGLAAQMGVDAFISGEIAERTTHEAQELGLYYFAIGHHASERYGIQALGEHLSEKFKVKCLFIDCDNPV